MSDFPLIHSLEHPTKQENKLPQGHNYTEKTVIVENKTYIIHVPTREMNVFESRLTSDISYEDFKQLLREVRGIRGNN